MLLRKRRNFAAQLFAKNMNSRCESMPVCFLHPRGASAKKTPGNGCWEHQKTPQKERSMKRLLALLLVCLADRTLADDKSARPIDNDFLINVATCNQAEVEYAKLADKRAGSAKVKDFAASLLDEHKTANDK